MQIFIFGSTADVDVVAFTKDQSGKNLPSDFAPWQPLGGSLIQSGDSLAGVSGGADAVIEGAARDSFFLARSEARLIHFPLPPKR
jgi:hypothetical protein